MIEGLKLKIPSSELKSHCSARSQYHKDRAGQKEAELPSLKEALARIKAGGVTITDDLAKMSGKGGAYHLNTTDAVENLENDIRDHRNKSLVFGFYAEHLFDEVYILQDSDLIRLEILKRW